MSEEFRDRVMAELEAIQEPESDDLGPMEGSFTLTPAPKDEDNGSRWVAGCPEWAMVVIQGGRAKVLASCGRYFDYDGEDLVRLEDENDPWNEPNGVYICEGGFVSERDWETGIEEGCWQVSDVRPATVEEWAQYCTEDEPWPPEFYADPVPKP